MLFESFEIKSLKSKNRIVMAPMCQYQAEDGLANDWHFVHYVSRAVGQVGIIVVEASAVEPRGRISMNDLGIWHDKQIEPLQKMVQACKKHGASVGIQLAHAGRKSRATGSRAVAPSPIAFDANFPVPEELSKKEIQTVVDQFGKAAFRAEQAGFDFVEVHGAHGYLISEFLSPITNKRDDCYGKDNSLFLKEVLESVDRNFQKEKPVFLRVSGEEYHTEGNHPESLGALLGKVAPLFDVLHVSSGGIFKKENYDVYPAYQLEYAQKLKELLKKPTIAVGKLEEPLIAQKALKEGKADLVAIGRGLLADPQWALRAANNLGVQIEWPKSYERAKDAI